MNNKTIPFIAVVLGLMMYVNGLSFWSSLGLTFTLYCVFDLVYQMGKKIPIIELMTTLAAMQWILGPYFEYAKTAHHYKYHMYVPEEVYMPFAILGVIGFYLGTLFFKKHETIDDIEGKVKTLLDKHPNLPYLLVFIGFIIPYFNGFIPSSLHFVTFLLSNIKYIGVIYLLFSPHKRKWLIFGGTMLFTATASIAAGMFHDFLLWAMLTFTFVAKELKLSFLSKLSFALLGVIVALSIQTVKHSYRDVVWKEGYSGNKISLFFSMIEEEWQNGTMLSASEDNNTNVRLNQGWIISAVMTHVPEKEPYAEGSTITDAMKASFLPRFLAPEKKKAGGQENFARFTGMQLNSSTSMGISLAGEGWANFGFWGGILFLVGWGVFIGWFWQKIIAWSVYYPTLLIWSPILFLQTVKAESELVVVLNHLIKASALVFGLLWFVKKQWGIRI